MPIVITDSTNGVAGKLADAEVHFDKGPLAGLKLVGFALWESQWPDRRTGQHVRVTMPSREYDGRDGERKRFDLLRAVNDQDKAAGAALRDAILTAFLDQQGAVDQASQMARQVGRDAQWRGERPVPPRRAAAAPAQRPATRPASRPAAAQRPAAPVRRSAPAGPPVPPPHTDDDYPF